MPQLAYSVSDLQQKTKQATIHDLMHANHVYRLAQKWALQDKQKLIFRMVQSGFTSFKRKDTEVV